MIYIISSGRCRCYTNKNSRILKIFDMIYYLHVSINYTSKMHTLVARARARQSSDILLNFGHQSSGMCILDVLLINTCK